MITIQLKLLNKNFFLTTLISQIWNSSKMHYCKNFKNKVVAKNVAFFGGVEIAAMILITIISRQMNRVADPI